MNAAAMANGSTIMHLEHLEMDEEFYARMKHNFKSYVLLSSKSRNWKEDVIFGSLFKLNGYKSHKPVKYDGITSHIHVKFVNEQKAKEALLFLNTLSSDLTAVLVDDMLRDWFNYEMKSGFGPPCTLTTVDIIGHPPLALNFLTSNILNSIFKDFGDPYLLPYTSALTEPHVQIMFGSMAEALAACMAFGEWYQRTEKSDSFCYRVRINPSDKEAKLVTHSGGAPTEAFRLDYFVNTRKEMPQNSKRSGTHNQQEKINRPNASQNKSTRKVRKQKDIPMNTNSQSSAVNQLNHRTPILFVPVIASMSMNNSSDSLVSTSRQFEAEFANALMNFQKSCSVSTRTVVSTNESEMEIRSAIQYDSSENLKSLNRNGKGLDSLPTENNFSLYSDQTSSNQTALIPAPQKMDSFSYRGHQKSSYRRHTRVFERRK